MHNFVL